jgi:hypothetical protein
MFLVIARTNLDDLPLELSLSKSRAEYKANHVTIGDIEEAARVMGVGVAGLINVQIVEFIHNKPASCTFVCELGEL